MASQTGKIRIIGGQWRSRRLQFPAIANLRPSPDAVRETLFNWLQHDIADSCCLDLFAGSGAFGFEAASRGARHVTFIEAHPQAARQLARNAALLEATPVIDVLTAKVEQMIPILQQQFDCVFFDPPFDADLVEKVGGLLELHQVVAPGGYVYLETRRSRDPLPIPATWHIIRESGKALSNQP